MLAMKKSVATPVLITISSAFLLGAPFAACVSTTAPLTPGVDAGLPGQGNLDGAVTTVVDSSTGGSKDSTAPTDATSAGDAPSGDGSSPTGDGGPCPSGWVQIDAGVCVLNLMGAWAPSTDANSNGPDTVAALGAVTATSVTVNQNHTGTSGADCGCNSQHLNIALGRTFSCSSTTLAFDFATTFPEGGLDDTPALDIRFCTGPCPAYDGGVSGPYFYGGPQYVGSPSAPAAVSGCGYEWENDAGSASLNYFPASAAISTTGTNTIPLGSYVAPASGDNCTGTFDTIDVHMQVYNCFTGQGGGSTLSNLRLY
jgi:hypothetical protein